MLYISDPCSQLETKNVTYNAFRFANVQQELRCLHEALLHAESLAPGQLASLEKDGNYFLCLFGKPTGMYTEAV